MHRIIWPVIILLSWAGPGCARQSAQPLFTLKQVGPGVWAAIDNPKAAAPAGANAGFVIGDDGVAVIDTFWSQDAARQLLADIQARTTLPVKFVINTHYHLDHVAGNGVFAAAGAIVVAHENVRGWIREENLHLLGAFLTPELKALTKAVAAPMVVYETDMNLYLGTRRIQVRSLPGHTGGDSVVFIPDAKVVFAGDLVWRNMLPNLIDASTKPWIETLDSLVADSAPDSAFVPGHGELGKASDVVAFRDYLAALRTLVEEARARGQSGDALTAAVLPALREKYGAWEFIEPLAKDSILQTDAEMRGTKRIPQP